LVSEVAPIRDRRLRSERGGVSLPRLSNSFLQGRVFLVLESLRFLLVSRVASVRDRRLRSGREGVSLPRLSHFCSAESGFFGVSEIPLGFRGWSVIEGCVRGERVRVSHVSVILVFAESGLFGVSEIPLGFRCWSVIGGCVRGERV
jgi:hypothetical protein